jgi:hypothetical protein
MILMKPDFICPRCGWKTPAKTNESNNSKIQSLNDSDSSVKTNMERM